MKKTILSIVLILVLIACLVVLTGCFKKAEENTENGQVAEESGDTNTGKTTETSSKVEYDLREGVLNQVVDEDGNPKQTDFIINGLILVGNRHNYAGLEADTEGVVEKLAKEGYKKTGINSSFYLNEWIEFYVDTEYEGEDYNIKVFAVPHKSIEKLEEMYYDDLLETAAHKGLYMNYETPDEDNYKYVGEGYINMDNPEGKYDILFMYKQKIAYFMTVDLSKEPQE